MSIYLTVKWIHILSSTLLAGTGFGSVFYYYLVLRSNNLPAITRVSELVVRADWWFTTPAVLLQPFSGLMMIEIAGYP